MGQARGPEVEGKATLLGSRGQEVGASSVTTEVGLCAIWRWGQGTSSSFISDAGSGNLSPGPFPDLTQEDSEGPRCQWTVDPMGPHLCPGTGAKKKPSRLGPGHAQPGGWEGKAGWGSAASLELGVEGLSLVPSNAARAPQVSSWDGLGPGLLLGE